MYTKAWKKFNISEADWKILGKNCSIIYFRHFKNSIINFPEELITTNFDGP